MRRIDSSLSLAALAVFTAAFAACSKTADTSPDAALKAAATGKSTAKAPDTKPVDTKATDAKATDAKATGAKAADTKTAGAKTADTKTSGAKADAKAPPPPAAQPQNPPAQKTAAAPPPAPKPVVAAAPAAHPVNVSGGTINPGMSKAQVIALLGKPASDRMRGDFTYLLFPNGIEKQVGMSDLVVLQGDKVVDAVLRAPNRTFSGTSSSPRAIPADEAAKKKSGSTLKGGAFTP